MNITKITALAGTAAMTHLVFSDHSWFGGR